MPVRSDPSALRWLIGVQLTNYRKRAGQTMAAAAAAIGCTAGKIGHLESGRNQQQPAEITGLLRFYDADLADIERLASLAGSADRQTWWAPWTDVVPDWLRTFVGLEGLASHVAQYAASGVPALLQTEDYSLGVTTGGGRVRPDHDERTVSLRMERQRRLFSDAEPLELTALIEESVLDRPIGSTATMRAQLEHLIAMSKRDNVEILVLPTAIGAHDGLVGPFTLLNFAAAQSIVYVEIVNGAVYVQDQQQVAGYTRIVDRLRAVALPPARTAEVIRSRLSTLS
ncbi:MAG: helix-turn-helix domain-containing protein [Actinomycetota bacterium]|nr:helix-turn-helix domain-containing protein [Actinomycetota bacterium]